MEFHILKREDHENWNQFVDTSLQGSLFAKSYYLDAIGLPYKIGVLKKNETIKGGIVLSKNEMRLFANPLFAKYLGILLCPIESKYVNRITEEKKIIENIVANLNHRSFDYTFHPEFQNWLPFYWKGYRQTTRYTYRIASLKSVDQIIKNVESRVRKNIRKAEKHNIYIENKISLADFYRINELSFIRQGGPIPFSFSFFTEFYNTLKKHNAIELLAAKDTKNQIHAVCGIVYDNKCGYLLFNGSNPDVANVEANTLLVMKTIEHAAKVTQAFDFEGSMLKPIERFYRGFGGEMTAYMNIWKHNSLNTFKRFSIKLYKKIRYGN
jgi:hypothetical protein